MRPDRDEHPGEKRPAGSDQDSGHFIVPGDASYKHREGAECTPGDHAPRPLKIRVAPVRERNIQSAGCHGDRA
jgi:hypothetical protein